MFVGMPAAVALTLAIAPAVIVVAALAAWLVTRPRTATHRHPVTSTDGSGITSHSDALAAAWAITLPGAIEFARKHGDHAHADAWAILLRGINMTEQTVQVGRIALGCKDCGEILTATVTGQHEAKVRHTRDETYMALTIEAPEFHAAVSRHRARGCPARHFKQINESEA